MGGFAGRDEASGRAQLTRNLNWTTTAPSIAGCLLLLSVRGGYCATPVTQALRISRPQLTESTPVPAAPWRASTP